MKTAIVFLLQEAEKYLTGAAIALPSMSRKLLSNGSEEFPKLVDLIDGLQELHNLLTIAGNEAGFDWSLQEIKGLKAIALINDLNESNKEMIEALTNKDYILVTDLLEFVLPLKLLAYRQLFTTLRQKLLSDSELPVEETQEVIM